MGNMDELLDMMITDESPSQISDKIKDMLYSKTASRVDIQSFICWKCTL